MGIVHHTTLGQRLKVCLLGATFETNNMGVKVLTTGVIKCFVEAYPDCEIVLLNYGERNTPLDLKIGKRNIKVRMCNLRFSIKLYLKNTILILLPLAVLIKFLPFKVIKDKLIKSNTCFDTIRNANIIASIAGGDSFSDTYKLRQFLFFSLPQLLVIFLGKKLVQLPQTYGPFKRKLTKLIARYILKHSSIIYSRDYDGPKELQSFARAANKLNVQFGYDVGFTVEPEKPRESAITSTLTKLAKKKEIIIVGLNISGMLQGRSTKKNRFKLSVDYGKLVLRIIRTLFLNEQIIVVIIPHVYGSHANSDYTNSIKLYGQLKGCYPNRLYLIENGYNEREIKYLIGLCDFFIGSRMHACIAAISQCTPAVGLAYSKKFKGVFPSIGGQNFVADLRELNEDEIVKIILQCFRFRRTMRKKLQKIIPNVKLSIYNTFRDIIRNSNIMN